MALQEQELAIAFGGGLDKKTDPKAIVAGKMIRLENAVFTEGHQIAKRYGYDSLTNKTWSPYTGAAGTLTSPKMVKDYLDELVCADSNRLYSYSPNLGAWVDKGPYESIESSLQDVSSASPNTPQGYQSCAVVGNYMLCTWQQSNIVDSSVSAAACIFDLTTGAKILPDTLYAAAAGNRLPKCAVLGGTTLALFLIDGSGQLFSVYYTISGNTVTATVGSVIYTGLTGTSRYAVAGTATGGVVAFGGGTKTISSVGAVVNTATGFTGFLVPFICVGTDGNIWVYGALVNGGSTIATYQYIIYTSTLAVVLATTNVYVTGAVSLASPRNIVAVATSTTLQTAVMSTSTGTADDPFWPLVTRTLTSGGVQTADPFTTSSADILSPPFLYNGHRYIFVLAINGRIPSVYLMNMDVAPYIGSAVTGAAVAKFLWGTAALETSEVSGLQGFLSNVVSLSSAKFAINTGYLSETIGNPSGGPIYSSILGMVDFNSQDAYQGLVANDQLILNGGVPSMYDGNVVAELGFLDAPQVSGAFSTGLAGNIPDGTRYYVSVLQWTDNQGNLHQSAPSDARQATNATGVTPSSYTVTVPSFLMTSKDPSGFKTVTVAIYRTTDNGSVYYQCGHKGVTGNPSVASTITFTDNFSDATLITGLPLYTNGNVLANDPPPPFMIMNSHNNRVWVVDSTNPNDIEYSKTAQATVGISFSGDLTATIDSKGGSISGMVELDTNQVVFKENDKICILYGDGANDTGTGSTLSNPQFSQTDVGCNASKSIISQPDGIIFKSDKGWYQLDRSTQVSYIGFPVQSYNTQNVTGATRLDDQTLCIFLTDSGSTIAYDYFFKQWSTFTNHNGYGADIFQGLYTYVRTDGSIYKQNTTSYLDGTATYLLKAQTSWLHVGKLQGFQRIRKTLALGDHLSPVSGHGLQISAAYDFVESYSTPVVYTFTDTGAVFQYREALPRQKCDTVSLFIEEVTALLGTSGEYINLTDLGFEAAVKRGPNKLPAAQSVG